jgi:hypothetical protein
MEGRCCLPVCLLLLVRDVMVVDVEVVFDAAPGLGVDGALFAGTWA